MDGILGSVRCVSLSSSPHGLEGELSPPAIWPPVCYGALGRSERIRGLLEHFLSLSPPLSLSLFLSLSLSLLTHVTQHWGCAKPVATRGPLVFGIALKGCE